MEILRLRRESAEAQGNFGRRDSGMGVLRQGEGDVHTARAGLEVFATASGDHDKLTAIHGVSRWRGISRKWQICLPQQSSIRNIVGAELLVVVGCADEEKTASCDDRPAVIFRTGVAHSRRGQFRILAERNFPEVFAGVQIDGVQRSPWRKNCGITVWIKKAIVAGEVIFHCGWRRTWA